MKYAIKIRSIIWRKISMFNLSKKKINKIMAFAIAFTMLFASQVTAFAATTSSKTVTSSKAMSVALLPGVTGNSNTITFNFNSLPDKAIVKEVEIDCSNASVIGGKGAILAKSLTITSPSGETHTVSWGKGNVTITNLFIAEKAAGTWSVYMTGTNADVLYAKYEYLSKCKQ
jgi:hypothetical protein